MESWLAMDNSQLKTECIKYGLVPSESRAQNFSALKNLLQESRGQDTRKQADILTQRNEMNSFVNNAIKDAQLSRQNIFNKYAPKKADKTS